MKRYILDTNIVSDLQTDTEVGSKILEKLKNLDADDEVLVSIIVLYELVYGLNNISDEKQKEAVEQGISFIKKYLSIIPLDMKEIDIFANLKTNLI
jgi:predicted nucleic acid-binding protein